MLKIRKPSGWIVDSAGGVGASVGLILDVGASKGILKLKSERGVPFTFHYASAGAGVGVGAKLSLSYSGDSDPDVGKIFILESFRGGELQPSDLIGGSLILEL